VEIAKATTDVGASAPLAARGSSRAVLWGSLLAIVVMLIGIVLARR
jgi:hypothetical protein